MKLTWQRYYLFDILESNDIDYNQILMVDSDTIVHPNSPNFFELSENKYCGVVNPLSDWILRSIEVYSKAIFKEDKMVPYYNYMNGGFQIVNKEHKDFFKIMTDFYHSNKPELLELQNNYHLGSDQTPLNFLLDINKISCKLLSYKFNMQELVRTEALSDDMIHTKMGWVYHFNTWPKPNPRYWLEKTYRYLNG
jgi:lipopolysaccharide biosynthesis glycosyltransferase